MKFWQPTRLLIRALALTITLAPGAYAADAPVAKSGLLDLTDWDLVQDGSVDLRGEWEFYWQHYLGSEAFLHEQAPPPEYVAVPGYWNDYTVGGEDVPGPGYATYRLNILVPLKEPFALKLLSIGTAYKLYVDGVEVAHAGRPGITAADSNPAYRPQVVTFVPSSTRVEVIFHVANFHHRNAGLWEVVRFGTPEALTAERENQLASDLFLFGAIVMMAFYNLSLWGARRGFDSALYLGLFCLLIALRILLVEERYVQQLLPGAGWQLLTRVEYISWFLSVPVFLSFMHSLFPRQVLFTAVRVLWGIGLAAVIMGGLLPIRLATEIVPPYQAITLAAIAYGLYAVVISVRNKEEGSMIMAVGCALLFLAAINDILVNNAFYDAANRLQLGLFIFILMQSVLVSMRYSRAWQTIDAQSSELDRRSLELQMEAKLRRAAERRSQELMARADEVRRLDLLALIARGTVGTSIAQHAGSLPTSLLEDLVSLVSERPLARSNVDFIKVLKDVESSDEIKAIKAEHEDIRLSFDIPAGKAFVHGAREQLFAMVVLMCRFAVNAQPVSTVITVAGETNEIDETNRPTSELDKGPYLVLGIEDQGNGIREGHLVGAYEVIQDLSLNDDVGFANDLVTALALLEEYDGVVDVKTSDNHTRINIYLPIAR